MKIKVQNISGESVEEMDVQFPLIEEEAKGNQAVHDSVVAYMAAQRSGTACAKTRSEVSGTGKKPWRQKGTGRARAGSLQSPIWRGGGVVFGPRPRDFSKAVNKKTRKLALRKALSERLKAGEVTVVDALALSEPKTKGFLKVMDGLKMDGTTLVVLSKPDPAVLLSTRNIPYVGTTTSESLNTYDTLKYDRLLFTKEAFEGVQSRLA